MGSGGMYPNGYGAPTYSQYANTPQGQNRIGSYNSMGGISPLGQWSGGGTTAATTTPRYSDNMYAMFPRR